MEGLTAKQFAKLVVSSPEFYGYVVNGLKLGTIQSAIVMRLMDYAEGWGKPAERLEISKINPFDDISVEQLEARIALLNDVVRHLRGDDATDDAEQPRGTGSSVH